MASGKGWRCSGKRSLEVIGFSYRRVYFPFLKSTLFPQAFVPSQRLPHHCLEGSPHREEHANQAHQPLDVAHMLASLIALHHQHGNIDSHEFIALMNNPVNMNNSFMMNNPSVTQNPPNIHHPPIMHHPPVMDNPFIIGKPHVANNTFNPEESLQKPYVHRMTLPLPFPREFFRYADHYGITFIYTFSMYDAQRFIADEENCESYRPPIAVW